MKKREFKRQVNCMGCETDEDNSTIYVKFGSENIISIAKERMGIVKSDYEGAQVLAEKNSPILPNALRVAVEMAITPIEMR